jgi:UDP-hydrolysing UDP-N-acetyl-D-glucosamine 2-epimerase
LKKICVVINSRANYGTVKSVLRAASEHKDVDLQIVTNGAANIEKYGCVSDLMVKDGYFINESFDSLVEGENLLSMVKTVGMNLIQLPNTLDKLRPDVVVTVGDRYETISNAIAASFMNIPVAHIMGGEVSGTIDENVRHAITKLSHVHFPATKLSAERIIKMGENPKSVYTVGCPRIDLVREYVFSDTQNHFDDAREEIIMTGVGDKIDPTEDFILLNFHPVTTEYEKTHDQIDSILKVLDEFKLPVIGLWPNSDAGSAFVSRSLRIWRESNYNRYKIRMFKNLSIKTYMWLMDKTKCQVGNSSSGIREGSYIGTPVVNIGTRQVNRERAENVIDVGFDSNTIREAIQHQLIHTKYNSSELYGSGDAGIQIIDRLAAIEIEIHKRMSY